MDTKIKIFKTLTITIGSIASLLGLIALMDGIGHNDYSIATLVSVIGFLGVGLILLSVSGSLKYVLTERSDLPHNYK